MALNLNVLGGELRACCFDPVTGFYRDGSCRTGEEDAGTHVVCARMTVEFLNFSVLRWKEAYEAGCAPPIVLAATHERALDYVSLEALKRHALDAVPDEESP
jgi:uncharacterized protein